MPCQSWSGLTFTTRAIRSRSILAELIGLLFAWLRPRNAADDAAHFPGSPTERIAAAFYADVELIDGFDGTAAFDCTDKQRVGIGESKGNYAANDEVELIGLRVLRDGDEFGGFPDGALIVEFTYRDAGDDDRDRPGREVTVFGADGMVLARRTSARRNGADAPIESDPGYESDIRPAATLVRERN